MGVIENHRGIIIVGNGDEISLSEALSAIALEDQTRIGLVSPAPEPMIIHAPPQLPEMVTLESNRWGLGRSKHGRKDRRKKGNSFSQQLKEKFRNQRLNATND